MSLALAQLRGVSPPTWNRLEMPLRTMTSIAAQAIQPKRVTIVRITRARVCRSSIVRTAGMAATNRKNWGPTQTATARMCSQGVTASDISSDYTLKTDRLLTLRPDRHEANRYAQHILDEANIGLGLDRKVFEVTHARGILPPSRRWKRASSRSSRRIPGRRCRR